MKDSYCLYSRYNLFFSNFRYKMFHNVSNELNSQIKKGIVIHQLRNKTCFP